MVCAQQLAACFNRCFGERYNVHCQGGGAEPRYLVANGSAVLTFTRDYPASALHEIAHWCIAGVRRLGQDDFGYNYLPPPRDPAAQQAFYASELKVQALECTFARATGIRFVTSADNFELVEADFDHFKQQVDTLAAKYWSAHELGRAGILPPRASQYLHALQQAGLAQAVADV